MSNFKSGPNKSGKIKRTTKISNQQLNKDLINACTYGQLSRIQSALAEGANIDAQNGEPLSQAAINGQIETMQFLIANGANIKKYGNEILYRACTSGQLKSAMLLIDNGAQLVHIYSTHPFVYMIKNGYSNMVKPILKKVLGTKITDAVIADYLINNVEHFNRKEITKTDYFSTLSTEAQVLVTSSL